MELADNTNYNIYEFIDYLNDLLTKNELIKYNVYALATRSIVTSMGYLVYVFRTISVQCSGDTRSLLSGKDRLLATKLILFS